MRNGYFDSGDVAIAVNFKVASASIARAVIKAHHPEIEATITTPWNNGRGTAYPSGVNADTVRWQTLVPKVSATEKPVLLLMRPPVEKFRSACAEDKVRNVNFKLTQLERDTPRMWSRNAHFWPQSRFLENVPVKVFRIGRDLEAFCQAAGLEYPLSWIGPAGHNEGVKPDLTPEQTQRVRAIYADDLALFASANTGIADVPAVQDADPTHYEGEAVIRRRREQGYPLRNIV